MPNWEYKLERLPARPGPVMNMLNQQGDAGWELVALLEQPELGRRDDETAYTAARVIAYFKRPKVV